MTAARRPIEIRLAIPDAGALITLAHGDLLDILLRFAPSVRLIVTDVVHYEVTRRNELVDAQRLQKFFSDNNGRIEIQPTGFHGLLNLAKTDQSIPLPPDIGELSIYGFIDSLRQEKPKFPTLVIFEDNWFIQHAGTSPADTHLLSLAAFLKYIEKVMPEFSYAEALARIRHSRPGFHQIEIDRPFENEINATVTEWVASIAPN